MFRDMVQNATLEVRSGFFMLCVSTAHGDGNWNCNSNATALAQTLGAAGDPLNLIEYSDKFMSQIVFYGLIIGAIVLLAFSFLLFATFPDWHRESDGETGSEHEVKPFPSKAVTRTILAFLGLAALFTLVSVLWQHIATAAVATSIGGFADGAVKGHVGAAIMALGWVGVGLTFLVFLGTLVMIKSIEILDILTD